MCRALNPGPGQPRHAKRRCPYHENPHVAAVANAKTSIRRLENRLDRLENESAPNEKIDKATERLCTAYSRLGSREQQAIPATGRTGVKEPADANTDGEPTPHQVLPEPQPSAAESLTAESIKNLSWDEVSDLYGRYADDPEAVAKLELLVDEKEAAEGGQENDSTAWQQSAPPFGQGDQTSNPTLRTVRKLTPHEVAREEYDNYVYSQYSKCESELSFMVNPKGLAKGIDGFSLFTGPVSRAKKYGTEELQAWFAMNGRHTLGSFRHGLFGWASDYKAARTTRLEGFENVAHVV